jgi:hypothetical protein
MTWNAKRSSYGHRRLTPTRPVNLLWDGSGGPVLGMLADAYAGVEEHVAAGTTDLLVAAKQSFAVIACLLSGSSRSHIPRFDIQLDPIQVRDSPRKVGKRNQPCDSETSTTFPGCDAVPRACTALLQPRQPQPDMTHGTLALGVDDGEGEPAPLAGRPR